ncbi:MAG TPA: HemK2/MTQ2 family protein methyltransferase [Candidatus Nanoarchaeia archaeon]|nr:HemK2/MTQ2 family protein methyltransferase [Candidatus Nanoarchaeia archaeon]
MTYQPAEDSFLLAAVVKNYAKNKTVLDMGTGSGIQAQTAFTAKAKTVLAADIDPEVISHLKKKIPSIQSDLFSNISSSFDLIICNPPYLPEDTREPQHSRLQTTGGKKGDELILRFLKTAPDHLNKKGIILLLLSSLTPQKRILSLLKKENLTHEIIAEKKLFFESLYVWKIEKIISSFHK